MVRLSGAFLVEFRLPFFRLLNQKAYEHSFRFYLQGTLLRFDVPFLKHFSKGSEFLLGVALLSSHRFA